MIKLGFDLNLLRGNKSLISVRCLKLLLKEYEPANNRYFMMSYALCRSDSESLIPQLSMILAAFDLYTVSQKVVQQTHGDNFVNS